MGVTIYLRFDEVYIINTVLQYQNVFLYKFELLMLAVVNLLCTLLSNALALLSLNRFDTIEHPGNRIIFQSGMFENEIGPGVLQSSVRQTGVLEECAKFCRLYVC